MPHHKRPDSKQVSVKRLDDELAESIRGLAEREGISLNQAALRLLRKGAGLTDGTGGPSSIGSSLDDLFGTWSREDAEAFNTPSTSLRRWMGRRGQPDYGAIESFWDVF